LGKLDGRRIEEEGLSDEDTLAYHLREMEFMGWVLVLVLWGGWWPRVCAAVLEQWFVLQVPASAMGAAAHDSAGHPGVCVQRVCLGRHSSVAGMQHPRLEPFDPCDEAQANGSKDVCCCFVFVDVDLALGCLPDWLCSHCATCCCRCVFNEASAQVGHTIDRVVTVMDAAGLTFSMLTGYTQRVRYTLYVQQAMSRCRMADVLHQKLK
jgi:hypothetical protein